MNRSRTGAVIVFVSLLLVSAGRAQEPSGTPPTNEAILHQVQELEEEVKALRAEVTALKAAPAPPPTATSPAPAEAAAPAPSAAALTNAPAATPAPTGLAGLLGPTTLSGFVDTYYGYNPNHPFTRQNGLTTLTSIPTNSA